MGGVFATDDESLDRWKAFKKERVFQGWSHLHIPQTLLDLRETYPQHPRVEE